MRDRSNWMSSIFRNPLAGLEPSWRQALQAPAVAALIALLLIQLVAALVLAGRAMDQQAADDPLLAFAPAQVTRIQIQGAAQTLELERRADAWVLPALEDFPANSEKVDQLLQRLTGLARPLPVGTSPETRERLRVAETNAETRLILAGNEGELASLLFGDSPGFRRLYARLAGEPEVYDLPLASFEIASDSSDWIRRDKLRLEAEAIERIQADGPTGGWALTRIDGGWRLDDHGEVAASGADADAQQALDPEAINALLSRIAHLSYQGVRTAASETGASATPAEPVLSLAIGLTDGEQLSRTIFADDDGGYLLETGAEPLRYVLSEYDLDGLLGLEPESLIAEPSEPTVAAEPAEQAEDRGASGKPTRMTADAQAPISEHHSQPTSERGLIDAGTAESAVSFDVETRSSPPTDPLAAPERTTPSAGQITEGAVASLPEPGPPPESGPEAEVDAAPATEAAASEPSTGPAPSPEQRPAPQPGRGAAPPWPYPHYPPQHRPPWTPQGPVQGSPPQAPPGWR